MSSTVFVPLFLFGTAIGSFLNVAILRFDPERKLFSNVGGRSCCMSCGKVLRWYELIPLLSFVIQLGRCRGCGARLSLQYPLVELATGFVFVLVPYLLMPVGFSSLPYIQIAIWMSLFVVLTLISVIDFRLYIIPDGLNIAIGVLALLNVVDLYLGGGFGTPEPYIYNSILGETKTVVSGSLLGTKATFLFLNSNLFLNFFLGGLFGLTFFGGIYFLSRGAAMGLGDVKMALFSGLLLGLPDMILATMLAFISGAIGGLFMMLLRKKGMKDHLPFGPFIALGITLVFLFGYDIIDAYLSFWSFLE